MWGWIKRRDDRLRWEAKQRGEKPGIDPLWWCGAILVGLIAWGLFLIAVR